MADPPTSSSPETAKSLKHSRRRRLIEYISFVAILGVLGLAIAVLTHFLRNLDVAKVVETIGTIPWPSILLGTVFGIGGYVALVGYDWSALQYIGKRLPFRSVLLASFCGYAIGNTAGFTLVTGGAVRLRIYSRAGLDVADIGRVTLFCMVAFGFGICAVSALSLLAHPHALADLVKVPAETVSAIGLAILILVVAFLILCGRGREVRILKWQFKLPSAALVVRLLLISAVDIGFACATLYVVLPHGAGMAFADFLPVFCAALAFGIISHVPGGVGVFEATMIYALRHKLPAEQLVGGLLMFRIIYYIVPLAQAVAILSLVEAYNQRQRLRARLLSLPRLWPAAVAGLALVLLVFLMVTRDTIDTRDAGHAAPLSHPPPASSH
jgi:phosphatidylglycerol lysyltransferase